MLIMFFMGGKIKAKPEKGTHIKEVKRIKQIVYNFASQKKIQEQTKKNFLKMHFLIKYLNSITIHQFI